MATAASGATLADAFAGQIDFADVTRTAISMGPFCVRLSFALEGNTSQTTQADQHAWYEAGGTCSTNSRSGVRGDRAGEQCHRQVTSDPTAGFTRLSVVGSADPVDR
jgi:hypothetical protein